MIKKHINMYESAHLVESDSSESIVLHTSGLSGCLATAALFDNGYNKAIFLSHFPPTGEQQSAERNIRGNIDFLQGMGYRAISSAIIAPGKWVQHEGSWITRPYDTVDADIKGYEAVLGIKAQREAYEPYDGILFAAEPDREYGKGTARISYDPSDTYSNLRIFAQGAPIELKPRQD